MNGTHYFGVDRDPTSLIPKLEKKLANARNTLEHTKWWQLFAKRKLAKEIRNLNGMISFFSIRPITDSNTVIDPNVPAGIAYWVPEDGK